MDIDTVMRVKAAGGDAARVAAWGLRLEGILHQIGDHEPPDGVEPLEWVRQMARWAIRPDMHAKPIGANGRWVQAPK